MFETNRFVQLLFMASILVSTFTVATEKKHSVLSLEHLEETVKSAPQLTITVFEHLEKKNITFRGIQLRQLLDDLFGRGWKDQDEIELVCRDGYRPIISTSMVKKYDGYLVYKRVGSENFTVKNRRKNGKLVDLAPFYLVWDNIKDPSVNEEGGSLWSYQIVDIILKDGKGTAESIAPRKRESQKIHSGYALFKKHCISCHSIDGVGGKIGPSLTTPVNITLRLKRQWMEQWISNPQAFDPKTKMTALSWAIKDKEKLSVAIDEIISYLSSR